MRDQNLADVSNRVDERVRKLFIAKMFAHKIDNALPVKLAAFLVGCLIAYNRELMRARRHENQYGVAFVCLVHPKPLEFLLGHSQRISIQLSTLDVDADLRGRLGLDVANRLHDPVMLELAQKFFRSHFTSSNPRHLRR